jgi:response regulator RpfG family c-di-GMP phosphodiesterase
MLDNEIAIIGNFDLREAVRKVISENEKWFRTYPCSITGKYHKKEPTMEIHIQRCCYFAKELCREFDMNKEDGDIILAATILHDIGLAKITYSGIHPWKTFPGEHGWNYYPETDWSRLGDGNDHPKLGGEIIRKLEMPFRDEIARAVERHMDHWVPGPRAESLLERIVAISDYLASRNEITIQSIWDGTP